MKVARIVFVAPVAPRVEPAPAALFSEVTAPAPVVPAAVEAPAVVEVDPFVPVVSRPWELADDDILPAGRSRGRKIKAPKAPKPDKPEVEKSAGRFRLRLR